MSDIWMASYAALWCIVLFEGVLIFVLIRELGVRLLSSSAAVISRDGLAVGTEAPTLEVLTPSGEPRLLLPEDDRTLLVIFGSRRCQPCRMLVPDLNRLARSEASRVAAVFVVYDNVAGAAETAVDLGLEVPVLASREAIDAYGVRVTPFAFVVGRDRRVQAKGLASGGAGLRHLLAQAERQSSAPPSEVAHATQFKEVT
jgi:thiol-disulfide isomerase/thioredoxin